ncbi:thymidylate synthase [Candidatus Beckwithbacteria bacterium]|nr:thymidylate synthase [Candidatus Beckwithbacteria bacterium]
MSRPRHPEYQYLDLLDDIMKHGVEKISHSTGMGLRSVFGRQIRFDLSKGFPLLTTKKVYLKGIIHELLWFISGSSNITYMTRNNVHIWDDWAYKNYKVAMELGKVKKMEMPEFVQKIVDDDAFAKKWGEIGPVYGAQWRRWPTGDGRHIDQLKWAIDKIKEKPHKKHYIISAWNAAYIYEMAKTREDSMVIAPCHTFFHINIDESNHKLSLQMYQRSADSFLGVPFNIASYALLTMMLAQVTGYKPGDFVHTFGDIHVYHNHFKQVRQQLKRKPRKLPIMRINPKIKDIDKFTYEDFEIVGYNPHPAIKGEITVVGGF